MDFKNWSILFVTLGLVGYSAYYIGVEQSAAPSTSLSPTPQIVSESVVAPADWSVFEGTHFSFSHPEEWKPNVGKPFGGAVLESITLNIPDATDNEISFTTFDFDQVKPGDVVHEETFSDERGRDWTHWVRRGDGYVTYDIYTKDAPIDTGSFGVHVTLPQDDEVVQQKLLTLMRSVEFSDINASGAAQSKNL